MGCWMGKPDSPIALEAYERVVSYSDGIAPEASASIINEASVLTSNHQEHFCEKLLPLLIAGDCVAELILRRPV